MSEATTQEATGFDALKVMGTQAEDTVAREPKIDARGRSYATGKRKNAVARVWIKPGKGTITILGIAVPALVYGWHSTLTAMGFIIGLWVLFSALIEPVQRLRKGHSLSAGVLGMSVAHLGLGLFIVGATTVESYKAESDLSLRPGQSAQVAGFQFTMNRLSQVSGPNYEAIESEVAISRDGRPVAVVHPQKRTYRVQRNPMTEAGIDGAWSRDLFVAMGEPLCDGAWSLRLQYKPMVRFIWFGALVMAIGGIIAVCDRRYRQRVGAEAPSPASATARTA